MNQMMAQQVESGVEALLAGYVAGALAEPMHVLMAAHLDLSPVNRRYVRALETAAGLALEREGAGGYAPLPDRDARLAAIFAMGASPVPAPRAVENRPTRLPRPLARYLGKDFDDIAWKTKIPGVRYHHIADTEHGDVELLWIRAGQKMPTHTHEGSEVTLVIEGGFSDSLGSYARGDVAIADQHVDHRPIADDDGQDCLCFAVTDAPLRLTGKFGRWVQPFLRR